MAKINEAYIHTLSEAGPRGAFGIALMEVAEEHDNVVVMTADLAGPCRVEPFASKYPERYFNVGIAEQNMMGTAVGLALSGKLVFCTTFAAFTMRMCEQIRTDAAYMNANVKIFGADAGVTIGTQGYTHYAVEDISIMRAMPNMTIISPADGLETVKAVHAMSAINSPVYLRITGKSGMPMAVSIYDKTIKVKGMPIVYNNNYEFEMGKGITLREGNDMTIFATGAVLYNALCASDKLEKEHGIKIRVIDIHTIKPIDQEIIRKAAKETGVIFTIEEHSIIGGLGSAVCETAAELGNCPKIIRLGFPDKYVKIAEYNDQLVRFGLDIDSIVERVLQETQS